MIGLFVSYTDPESKNPAVNREAMMIPDKVEGAGGSSTHEEEDE
jgi:hypothetical protein